MDVSGVVGYKLLFSQSYLSIPAFCNPNFSLHPEQKHWF